MWIRGGSAGEGLDLVPVVVARVRADAGRDLRGRGAAEEGGLGEAESLGTGDQEAGGERVPAAGGVDDVDAERRDLVLLVRGQDHRALRALGDRDAPGTLRHQGARA